MSLSAYTAVTSNTVQFGAELEVYASSSGFTVHGYLAFDALFILSPFSFQVELQGGVDVLSGSSVLMSISFDLLLSGPRPWHVSGTGKIHVLFVTVSVHVDKTFGDATQQQLPQTQVLPLLKDALGKAGNWSASLPAGTASGVSLAPAPADPTQVLMHPMGQLTIRQKVVPLATQISLFGSVAPADADYFDIAAVQFAGTKESVTSVPDEFAPGQFFTLSDDQKLSQPAFESLPAGVTVGSADVQCGSNATVTVQYETFVVDDPAVPATAAPHRYTIPLDVQHALLAQSSGALSLARQTGSAKFMVPGARSPISTQNEAYVVAGADDLKTRADISDKGGTAYSTAQSHLQSYLAQHPEETGKLHVVPTHEAVAV